MVSHRHRLVFVLLFALPLLCVPTLLSLPQARAEGGKDETFGWQLRLPEPGPAPAPAIEPTTHGRILVDEVWTGEVRVVGDIIVEEGVTLTIEPGTRVLIAANQDVENLNLDPFEMQQGIRQERTFDRGVHYGEPFRDEGHHISIRVHGTLHAAGTPAHPITITSDSPTPGIYDWNYFQFDHGVLSYSVVEYYRVLSPGDGTEVSNNVLRHVGECAVCANGSVVVERNSLSDAGHELIDMHRSAPTIRQNRIGPNAEHVGIVIDGGAPQIIDNIVEGCAIGILYISPAENATTERNTFINNGRDVLLGTN